MKKLISCILALLLLTTAAFAVPGDSCVVLGEELTLGETDGIFTALGVERGTAMELALSRPDAETYFSDVPEKAASVGVLVRIRSGGEGLSLSLSNITGAETAIAAALTAAGVTDAEIVAAAPEETGALAILPAVFKAYETHLPAARPGGKGDRRRGAARGRRALRRARHLKARGAARRHDRLL